MPNISAHMVVCKLVSEKLNITSDDFIRGNLLPDIIDKEDSHHKIQGKMYLQPNIDYFIKNLDLTKDINIGYLTQLMLDKYYLIYLENKYPDNIVFDNGIYIDYDYINYDLVNRFNLDVKYLSKILSNYNCKINEEKLKYNIEYLNQKKIGKTKFLDINEFSSFLYDISNIISKELEKYANKYSKFSICFRK